MKIKMKGGKGSGWHAPPRGTHSGEKHRAVGSGKAVKPKEKTSKYRMAGSDVISGLVDKIEPLSFEGIGDPDVEKKASDIPRWAARHPEAVVNHVRIIEIGTRGQVRLELEKLSGTYKNITAFYVYGKRRMVLSAVASTQRTFDHEMGHAAWEASKTSLSWTTKYDNSAFDRHTEYSRANTRESFAESYQAYLATGGVAKNIRYAETFAAIEEVLDGLR